MKTPYNAIREVYYSNLQKASENQNINFNNLNKFVVWIVGFSTTGIALMVSNINNFKTLFPYLFIKILLYLLSLSIFSGVVFRYAFYILQTKYQIILNNLIITFTDVDVMSIDADSVEEENDIVNIINSLKFNFDTDFNYLLKDFNQVGEKEQQNRLLFLRARHKTLSEFTKKNLQDGINDLKSTVSKAYGITEEKAQKIIYGDPSKNVKIFRRLTNASFWFCCGSFLLVMILLTVFY
jgi:hypothetical protein